MVLISDTLTSKVINVTYRHGYCTDHSIVELVLNAGGQPRGRGFWKMNTKNLDDMSYCEGIAQVVEKAARKYERCNPGTQWEMIKCEIISFSQNYSHQKRKTAKDRLNRLIHACEFLTKLLQQNYCPKVEAELNKIKSEIEKDQHSKVQTLLFMGRARYYAEVE